MTTTTGAQFKCTKDEYLAISRIVKRANKMGIVANGDTLSLNMDLSACHSNGCPVDFAKLEGFDNFNFAHDICGIQVHINRETGAIEDFFLPRASR